MQTPFLVMYHEILLGGLLLLIATDDCQRKQILAQAATLRKTCSIVFLHSKKAKKTD